MSKIELVQAKIKEQLEALTNDEGGSLFNQVFIDPVTNGRVPYAEIITGGGAPIPAEQYLGGVRDVLLAIMIRITTHSSGDSHESFEDLITLWDNQALYLELNALGVLRIDFVNSQPAIHWHSVKEVTHHIEFLLEIRYTY